MSVCHRSSNRDLRIVRLSAAGLSMASAAFGAEETFSSNGGVLMLRTFLALAAVIALVWGSLWLLKRVTSGRKTDSGAIRVSGTAHLGPKQRIVLIDVEERRMVLGVTDQTVTMLADLGKTPKSKTKSVSAPSPAVRFADLLGSILKGSVRKGLVHKRRDDAAA